MAEGTAGPDTGFSWQDELRPAALATRFAPLLLCGLLAFATFTTSSADAIQPMSTDWAAGLTFWWCAPLIAVSLLPVRRASVIAFGIAYGLGEGLALQGAYSSDSSTAGFGVVFGPIYVAGPAAVFALVMRPLLGTRRRRPRSLLGP